MAACLTRDSGSYLISPTMGASNPPVFKRWKKHKENAGGFSEANAALTSHRLIFIHSYVKTSCPANLRTQNFTSCSWSFSLYSQSFVFCSVDKFSGLGPESTNQFLTLQTLVFPQVWDKLLCRCLSTHPNRRLAHQLVMILFWHQPCESTESVFLLWTNKLSSQQEPVTMVTGHTLVPRDIKMPKIINKHDHRRHKLLNNLNHIQVLESVTHPPSRHQEDEASRRPNGPRSWSRLDIFWWAEGSKVVVLMSVWEKMETQRLEPSSAGSFSSSPWAQLNHHSAFPSDPREWSLSAFSWTPECWTRSSSPSWWPQRFKKMISARTKQKATSWLWPKRRPPSHQPQFDSGQIWNVSNLSSRTSLDAQTFADSGYGSSTTQKLLATCGNLGPDTNNSFPRRTGILEDVHVVTDRHLGPSGPYWWSNETRGTVEDGSYKASAAQSFLRVGVRRQSSISGSIPSFCRCFVIGPQATDLKWQHEVCWHPREDNIPPAPLWTLVCRFGSELGLCSAAPPPMMPPVRDSAAFDSGGRKRERWRDKGGKT